MQCRRGRTIGTATVRGGKKSQNCELSAMDDIGFKAGAVERGVDASDEGCARIIPAGGGGRFFVL